MVRLVTRAFPQKEWTDLVSGFQNLSLIQTWEYANAKAQTGHWKVERAVFMEGGYIMGVVQALVRPIPWLRRGLVWINRGPLWRRTENENPLLLVAMMEELRRHWVERNHMYLRIAPCDREGKLDMKALEEIGYFPDTMSTGWASARLDLLLSLETLRAQLQQKWRNCLNKAERLGLTVQSGSDDSLFDEFQRQYKRILLEHGYDTGVTPLLLSRLQTLFPSERKLWVLTARQNSKSLGGVLIARYGVTCEYLVAAVNKDGRAVNAGQLLLWRAICEMKNLGYRWFDLGGIDRNRTPSGIFHFKAGLGGTPYRLVGEIEAHDGGWLSRVVRWRVSRARQLAGA